jgi:hypothetical protein
VFSWPLLMAVSQSRESLSKHALDEMETPDPAVPWPDGLAFAHEMRSFSLSPFILICVHLRHLRTDLIVFGGILIGLEPHQQTASILKGWTGSTRW